MYERGRARRATSASQADQPSDRHAIDDAPGTAISNRAIARSVEDGRLDPSLLAALSRAAGHTIAAPAVRSARQPGQASWATPSRIDLGHDVGDQAHVLAHEAIHMAQFSMRGPASSPAVVEAEAEDLAARLTRGRALPPIRERAVARSPFTGQLIGDLLGITVQDVIDRRDGDLVTYLSDAQLAATSWGEWRALIDEIHSLGWVSNRNERDLERLWGSLSADQLLDRPGQDLERWKIGVDRGADLYGIAAMRLLEREFTIDVREESLRCLRTNRALIAGDLDAFGAGAGSPADQTQTADQEDNLRALQDLAIDVMQLQQAMKELCEVRVGYTVRTRPVAKNVYRHTYAVATFDPNRPPTFDHEGTSRYATVPADDRMDGLESWERVKAVHAPLEARFDSLKSDTPALFALLEYGEGDALSALATGSPEAARALLRQVVGQVDAKAVEAIEKVSTGDLDPLDLVPIHQRLKAGHATPDSGRNWASDAGRLMAAEIVRGHEESEFWTSLGLASLAAAAFVVVELATFGTATFFIAAGVGLGLTGYQVGAAWEQYDDLADVSQATYDEDRAVVSRAQAEAARTAAIVETAFGFLDALSPAAKGLRAVAAGRGTTQVVEASEEALGVAAESATREAGDEAAGVAAREAGVGPAAVGAGIGEAIPSGAAAIPSPANLDQVADYLGRSIDELAEPPPGYRFFKRDGQRFIRRIEADDARFVKLSRDPSGLIVLAGRAGVASTRMVPLTTIARPLTLSDDMIVAAMDQLAAMPGLLRRKLGSFAGAVDGAVNSGHFGNLKGNIGEILGRTAQVEELDAVRRFAPDAEAFDTVKARYTGPDGRVRTVEFTDGIIASRRGGGLQVHNVVEVKARPRGGANAQSQIHRWIEYHLEDGFEIIVEGQAYTYMPGAMIDNPVVGLARAPRTIIAPRTAETLGLGIPEQIAPSVTRRALDYSDEELRYLVRLVIEELF